MVASGEQLRMLVVCAKFGEGFYLALVPADLTEERMDAACRRRERISEKRKKPCPLVVIAFAAII
jgi:hypothetical protein